MALYRRRFPVPFRFRKHTIGVSGGGGTIARDASSPAAVTSTAVATLTTASFSPPSNNTTLVAIVGFGSSTGTSVPSTVVTDSGSHTWTQQAVNNVGGQGMASVWTCPLTSAPGSITVSATQVN